MEALLPVPAPIYSSIVVSNDLTSKKININKNTNLASFYSEIISNFPELEDMKLFYFEGYLKEKFIISNEEEYVIANKKGIEYFYICGNKKNNDTIDYLKYYSVILFSPVKSLNKTFQINDRKKMQMEKLETINEIDENYVNGGNNGNMNMNNMNDINAYNQINNYNYNMNLFNNNNNYNNNNYDIINNFQGNNYNAINMNFNGNNNQFNNFINNNNNIMMNNFNPNIPNNLFILDNINKELFDAFTNDKNKYFNMINNINPALLEALQKRMAQLNNNNQLLNQNNNNNQFFNNYNNYNNINFNEYMNIYNNQNNINFYQNNFNNCINNMNMNNLLINNNINNNNININNNINEYNDNNNYNNENSNSITTKEIPEYETIDTESDPLNKYIENAINYSSLMKHLIVTQKKSNPDYFIDINETLSSPGLLSQKNPSDNDYKYILCLLGKILENQGIEVGIYKSGFNKDRIDLSAIQFIFSGLINKKKYRLKFSKTYGEQYFNIMEDSINKKKFIEEWKEKISNKLKIEKNLIILTNPRHNKVFLFIDLAFNPNLGEINEPLVKKLLVKNEIIDFQSFPLLGGCRLSSSIFKQKYNKYYKNLSPHLKRGGEEYIQPLNWTAYGLNISEKFDFGNDDWLGNKNKLGEFAVAYYGINNLNQNSTSTVKSLMGNNQTGKTFVKVKNIRKPGSNCKSGAYFFKNPKFAENSSQIITIGGFEYKIMFMCRVNPSKIMVPENFKDCWILAPTPDEVRPYKILIKKIPISALAIASQEEIQICIDKPPQIFFDIMQEKDESYFNKFNNNNKNEKFKQILREYTGMGSQRINNYLRNKKLSLPEKQLKSNIWCLHQAITQSMTNVQNNITVYRGITVKIPNNIGIGTKFYFKEFLSTSKDIKMAESFAGNGTLMHISIQNNGINGKKVYCRDIENISQFTFEKEIIFTAFCQFIVTDIERNEKLDVLKLTCDGYNF